MMKIFFWRVIIIVFLPIILLAQGENWVYRYNGSGNGWDETKSIVYGTDNNIYTAGYITGSSSGLDFTVISLTTAGDTNWVYIYNGPGNNNDVANSIVYGADDNIYAAGYTTDSSSGRDFTVISLTPLGTANWVYTYNGSGNGNDCANAIIYGADGNIYAAGYSGGSGTDADFTVISLTNSADTNWVYSYNGPGNSSDGANSIVFGSDGNIYAAGRSTGSGTLTDITVISLSTAGDTNWVYRYNGPGNMEDEAYSLAYGTNNRIYAAGHAYGLGTNMSDFAVISLSSTGSVNWIFMYNTIPGSYDQVNAVVYGLDSNIYAAGRGFGVGDFAVISLTTAGDTNWVYRYNAPGNSYDEARGITYGSDGNIYAVGRGVFQAGSYYTDIDVISLTPAGNTNWIYSYNGPGNSYDGARCIVYGSNGNIYAGGYSYGNGTDYDLTVISLPPDLEVQDKNKTALKPKDRTTILHGPLRLPKDKPCRVFDITGRVVMSDKLKPGIYFIEVDGNISQKIIKVR